MPYQNEFPHNHKKAYFIHSTSKKGHSMFIHTQAIAWWRADTPTHPRKVVARKKMTAFWKVFKPPLKPSKRETGGTHFLVVQNYCPKINRRHSPLNPPFSHARDVKSPSMPLLIKNLEESRTNICTHKLSLVWKHSQALEHYHVR